MSLRVRIDFSVSFFRYGLLQRDLFKKSNKRNQLGLEILLALHVFLIFHKAFPFLVVKEASLRVESVWFFSCLGV